MGAKSAKNISLPGRNLKEWESIELTSVDPQFPNEIIKGCEKQHARQVVGAVGIEGISFYTLITGNNDEVVIGHKIG